ncbi:MAG TPA: SAM-dependent methyltransferase [Trebonia sp.]|nr:SAM-dependent methyltransferase [Trebonia sp.]
MLDTSTPNLARACDYLLGGGASFAADRALALRLEAIHPGMRELLFSSRTYAADTVARLARGGVGQYLNVGSGLPTTPATHETARAFIPGARVVYVDRDPAVTDHGRVLVPPGVRYTTGDLAEPEAILASADVAGLLDLSEPVCLILTLVLQTLDRGTAMAVAGVLVRALAPGSYLIATAAPGPTGRLPDFTWPLPFTADDLASFFAGLDLLPPGVHEGPGVPEGRVLCAVGIKPGGVNPPGEQAGGRA